MLEVENVFFRYPSGASVRAHFRIAAGASCALMGASGAGKSTILHLIAGLIKPARGDVRFHGRSLLADKPSARPLTYLLQSDNLFAHLNVRENLAIGLHPGMKLTPEQNRAIDRALDWVALGGLKQRKPGSLSGGQQQRVALARCLARERPLLLLDEPFAALDQALREDMLTLLRDLQQTRQLTLLIATHRAQDAEALRAEVVTV
ncbi:MAG: ATP-binding cassette domain-containing protein [Gammaproteobacteria bacterium]